MTPFLKQVAKHYYTHTAPYRELCYIFPNRRSMLFFQKYYRELVKEERKTMLMPQMYTINDFFYVLCNQTPTEKIDLLLHLYENYRELMPQCESLDEFIFWGEMILSDFNDVDKYLVDARKLFTNVSEFKSLQDYGSYLNERQLKAIQAFMGHFSSVVGEDGKYKDSFRRTWDILYPLYVSFNKSLDAEGKSYEGKVYRALAERFKKESAINVLKEIFPDTDQFIFIGQGAPTESEMYILRAMHKAGLAQFCWDYSSSWIRDKHNRASFFLENNIRELGQSIELDKESLREPEINTLAVPSAVGQCKQLSAIFNRLEPYSQIGLDTAVVLADEGLLIPTLNAIPEEISKVNVTMGYPMSASMLYTFMEEVCALQMHLRKMPDGKMLFYHRQVSDIFSNPLLTSFLSDSEKQQISSIQQGLRHYIEESELSEGILSEIFRPVVLEDTIADKEQIHSLCEYLKAVLLSVAHRIMSGKDETLELDFAKEYYKAINCIEKYELAILPTTFFRLLRNLLGRSTVPFKGEPLQGLQIMGPLETRALDFKNVIILGCNEGVFPRHNTRESFIPAELRKGFDLPTHEYQDSLWAYYFYRLIQRADKIWMVYNTSSSQKLKSCEESRYIKQLELHFGVKINHFTAKSTISKPEMPSFFPKTKEHIDKLKKDTYLSASSIQSYLSCPAKFFLGNIENIAKSEEVTEIMDKSMIGTIVHNTMQCLYKGKSEITYKELKGMISTRIYKDIVREQIKEQLRSIEVTGRNLIYEHLACKYVEQILSIDAALIKEKGVNSFKIIGLEKREVKVLHGLRFKGFIDRIDSFEDGTLRIVDYKTGKVKDTDFQIDDSNATEIAEAAFGTDDDKRPKIAIQLFLYDEFVKDKFKGKSIENVIYQTSSLFSDGIKSYPMCSKFISEMEKELKECTDKILDINEPWSKTNDTGTCTYCDFKTICGR